MKSLIASLAPLVGCAVKISPGLLSLLSLMLAMGCASFWINLCKIYESRPLICRVDEAHKKLYPHIPLKEFYAKNAEVCNALQEANHMDKGFRVILKK